MGVTPFLQISSGLTANTSVVRPATPLRLNQHTAAFPECPIRVYSNTTKVQTFNQTTSTANSTNRVWQYYYNPLLRYLGSENYNKWVVPIASVALGYCAHGLQRALLD